MDETLRQFLDSLDDQYWKDTVKRLTKVAYKMMATHGFGGVEYADMSKEYALSAIGEAFTRCMEGAKSRFHMHLGDQSKSVEERFWQYLKLNCLRPLITADVEKHVSRSRWPSVPLSEASAVAVEIESEIENEAEQILFRMIELADDELGTFISAALKQLEDHPDRTDVNWTKLHRDLGITRYRSDQIRARLDQLRLKMIEAESAGVIAP